MVKPVLSIMTVIVMSIAPAAVIAHGAGQADDDHEARKKMHEKEQASQSWDSFMQKVKSQGKKESPSPKQDGDKHPGHDH